MQDSPPDWLILPFKNVSKLQKNMMPLITLTSREQELENLVIVVSRLTRLPGGIFSSAEKKYITDQVENRKQDLIVFNRLGYHLVVYFVREEKNRSKRLENCRKNGDLIAGTLNKFQAKRVAIFDGGATPDETLALAEGMALGTYQFLKHKTVKEEVNTLELIEIYSRSPEENGMDAQSVRIRQLNQVHDAVYRCRDLINEPHSHLTATDFAALVESMGQLCGASVEILTKPKLEALKMGGLLGVNMGSHEQPTFTVMEWKPENALNPKPLVLVGKGVMYDTGGMNLKPGDSMLNMKDDMSGAAAVASAIYAIASAKIPVHVVGLMPATDNRPGEKAIVPGDVITIHNGKTVEVINTDAEGRLILADALSYASRFDPMLVIDLATLTGAALRAIGKFGAAAMHSGAEKELNQLMKAGNEVYERLVEFPMWDEYGELIKSDIADLKNLGPAEAGMITAAKFLQQFTSYPYIHLDIAGPAFLEKRDSYRGLGGTGFGVRLLAEYVFSSIFAPLNTLSNGTTR
jgi:leucyl aminopeptidase